MRDRTRLAQTVVDACRAAALRREPAPSNKALARAIGVKSTAQASVALTDAERAGLCVVLRGNNIRVVAAPDGSWRTAGAVTAPHWRARPDRAAPRAPRREGVVDWSESDDATLRARWPHAHAVEIAAALGRTVRAVCQRAQRLGLPAAPDGAALAPAASNSIGAAEGSRTRGAEGAGPLGGGLDPAPHTIPAVVAGDRGPARIPGHARPCSPSLASTDWTSSTALPPAPSHAPAVLSRRCRFPLWGDGERPTHRYCDEATALGAYCAEHAARCFVQAFERAPNHKVTRATFAWGGKAA